MTSALFSCIHVRVYSHGRLACMTTDVAVQHELTILAKISANMAIVTHNHLETDGSIGAGGFAASEGMLGGEVLAGDDSTVAFSLQQSIR